MSKYTKGTWHAVGAWVEVEDDDVADICTCNPADIGQEHLKRSDAEVLANVRLIAAAPDMIELLKDLFPYVVDLEDVDGYKTGEIYDLIMRIKSVVYKAGGVAEIPS
jgi:hypothetical protein